MPKDVEKKLLGHLMSGEQEMRAMTSNPMFLSLLCAHTRDGYPFPETAHSVYESYIDSRFNRDEGRLRKHFDLSSADVRATAEIVAFCIAADENLSLSPTRQGIKQAASHLHFRLKTIDKYLDALEYIKIGRSETATVTGESPQFTFAHRRFQEYFATCVVLREPERVTPTQLLLDARWRETAVVLCQTQEAEVIQPLINASKRILGGFVKDVRTRLPNRRAEPASSYKTLEEWIANKFEIPAKAIHVLGLLQDGFTRRMDLLPFRLKRVASVLVKSASKSGSLGDRKSALDVSGVVPGVVMTKLLREAFLSRSLWLRESAFRQVAKLNSIPEDISYQIQRILVLLLLTGQLRKDRMALRAHLAQLDKAERFLSLFNLLIWLPRIDLLLLVVTYSTILIGLFDRLIAVKYLRAVNVENVWQINVAFYALLLLLWIYIYKFIPPLLLVVLSRREDALSKAAVGLLFCRLASFWVLGILVAVFTHALVFPSGIAALLFLVSMIWSPSVLYLASSHPMRFRLVFWPLVPMIVLSKAITKLRFRPSHTAAQIRESVVNFSSEWKENLKLMSLAIGVLGILFGTVMVLIFIAVRYLKFSGPIILILVVLAVVFCLLPILFDSLKWHEWKRTKPRQITALEFVASLDGYYTDIFRLRMLRLIRAENLITATPDAVAEIDRVGLLLEYRHQWDLNINAISEKSIYAKCLKRAAANFRRDYEILDEVYKLLEQLKSRIY
jgi:hypothetical protein